jgi:phenylacetic acid degradation operon negative regulatory protein
VPEPASEGEAFREYVLVLHEYRKFLFTDPGLPVSLQPEGFLALEAAQLFRSRRAMLELLVSAYVNRTFEGFPD